MVPTRPPEQEDARVPLKKQGVSSFVKHSCIHEIRELFFPKTLVLGLLFCVVLVCGRRMLGPGAPFHQNRCCCCWFVVFFVP